jgi:hypothetical protein
MRRDLVPPHLLAGPQAAHPRRGSGKKGNLVTNLILLAPGLQTTIGAGDALAAEPACAGQTAGRAARP